MNAYPQPVWLLDVDGVLNAPRPAWAEMETAKCAGLTIRWSPPLMDRIRTLHASGVVEVRWASTWCGFPEQLAALGAVLSLEFASAFGRRPMSKTWAELKVEAAVDVLIEGRRLVWADDCEVAAGRDLYAEIRAAESEGRALLVQPEPHLGLTAEHLDAIEAFLAESAATA